MKAGAAAAAAASSTISTSSYIKQMQTHTLPDTELLTSSESSSKSNDHCLKVKLTTFMC